MHNWFVKVIVASTIDLSLEFIFPLRMYVWKKSVKIMLHYESEIVTFGIGLITTSSNGECEWSFTYKLGVFFDHGGKHQTQSIND
jgi:hypothetical protein